jgi:hypothetical protein
VAEEDGEIMPTLAELERQLQALEQIESLSKDAQATLIASILAETIITMPREQLVPYFKSMMLRNPDLIDSQIGQLKNQMLKQYREAIKKARKESKITRK